MLEDLAAIAARAGATLKDRRQTIAVVDGSTGGLISASLLAMPGASAFYLGGGIIYTVKGRRMVLNHQPGSLRQYTSATEAYALAQADLIRKRYDADWGVAETGASGGSSHPRGISSGTSAIAVVGPNGVSASRLIETHSNDRLVNMQTFTAAALTLLAETLATNADA